MFTTCYFNIIINHEGRASPLLFKPKKNMKKTNEKVYEEYTFKKNGKYYLVVNGEKFRISEREYEMRERETFLRKNLFKI